MNSDLIMQILQWLVPSGIAGSLWAWLRHRENNKVLAAKERNDAYKEMYDNLSGTLIDLQNENIKLYKAVRELNRTIQRASTCRHYADCLPWPSCRSPEPLVLERAQPKRQASRAEAGFALLQQPVPPSMAKTKFPTDMLELIPVGTGFSRRSGQATVNVTRISEDSLEVTAACDSLARQILILTEENIRIRNELFREKEKPPPETVHEPTGFQWFQIWSAYGRRRPSAGILRRRFINP